jgi:hypothetical protein
MGLLTGAARLFTLPRFRGYTLVLAFTSSVFFACLGGAPARAGLRWPADLRAGDGGK